LVDALFDLYARDPYYSGMQADKEALECNHGRFRLGIKPDNRPGREGNVEYSALCKHPNAYFHAGVEPAVWNLHLREGQPPECDHPSYQPI
jgi:hypothetical protein